MQAVILIIASLGLLTTGFWAGRFYQRIRQEPKSD